MEIIFDQFANEYLHIEYCALTQIYLLKILKQNKEFFYLIIIFFIFNLPKILTIQLNCKIREF